MGITPETNINIKIKRNSKMKDTTIKTTILLAIASAINYFHLLVIPLMVLMVVMICDYMSGLVAAYINTELSSRKGIIGIIKK